jgi:hypothetical protein
MPILRDTDQEWAKLQRYRRFYHGSAALLALALLLITLRPEVPLLAGGGVALALILMLWAMVQLGAAHCPHCGYRLRSIDALFWKRCRQCRSSLTRGAA